MSILLVVIPPTNTIVPLPMYVHVWLLGEVISDVKEGKRGRGEREKRRRERRRGDEGRLERARGKEEIGQE